MAPIKQIHEQEILIVDDDDEMCNVLGFLFRSRGYRTISLDSGSKAVKWIENNEPDVILLDVVMPGMDSWETFRHLRDRSNAPVLFLTGHNSGEDVVRALTFGVNDFVRKPFSTEELLARVGALLGREQAQSTSPGKRLHQWEAGVRPTVSLILPTLNEAENLPLVLPHLPMEVIDEVILIDGLSTDGTVEVSRRIMPSIKVVMEEKPGKGAALTSGFRASLGDIIVVMDADGSNDPREIHRFIQALREGADFVKGSRFASGGGTTDMPRIRRFGNAGFVHLVNLLFNSTFTDLCYGYHAFWRYCLETLDLTDVNGFEVDTALYLRAVRKKLKIREVPSFEGYRFYGMGKLRTIPDGSRVLLTIFSEFIKSIRHPQRNLPLGFRAELAKYRKKQAITIFDETIRSD